MCRDCRSDQNPVRRRVFLRLTKITAITRPDLGQTGRAKALFKAFINFQDTFVYSYTNPLAAPTSTSRITGPCPNAEKG